MPEVSFAVGQRRYTLRCASGQEQHLRAVATALDARVRPLTDAAPGADDRQVLVMAAIALVDELQAVGRRPPAGQDAGAAALGQDRVADDAGELALLRAEHAALLGEAAALRDGHAALRGEAAALRQWAGGLAARLAGLAADLAETEGDGG